MENEPLRILIADDNDTDRMILTKIIQSMGYQTYAARDGEEAVEIFKQESPEIVLLDALMPNMDGFEAACIIKHQAGDQLVPIIFLTSLADAESLARCLDAGGDDFLTKPYNKIILKAKINAFKRMRSMHLTVQQQRDHISKTNQQLLNEQQVAKKVFDNVAHMGCLESEHIKHLLSPLSVFNGDVLLACRKPSGGLHVLLGDFTGHGLPAAIGAMPLAEIFYGMTNKGFGMSDVLREINQKLKNILPIGFFCCACMADLRVNERELNIWMGGLPDAFLRRKSGSYELISSNHLPLGVVGGDSFKMEPYSLAMDVGDRLYLWSDGIPEARNSAGEMYGDAQLEALFTRDVKADDMFELIKNSIQEFIGESDRDDDLTMVEVTMAEEFEAIDDQMTAGQSALVGPTDWAFSYVLRRETIRDFNVIPLLLNVTTEVTGLKEHSGQIYTIFAELLSNAVEHGVLGLSSEIKSTAEGFAEYYALREERMKHLQDQWVKVDIDHKPEGSGGVLVVRIEDSGPGFNFSKFEDQEMKNDGYSGRGIPLLRSLCSRVEYKGNGNIVEIEFHWIPGAS